MKFFWRILRLAILLAVLAEVIGTFCINVFMFQPHEPTYSLNLPGYVDIGTNEVKIAAVIYEHPYAERAIIRCAGNAEDAAATLWALKAMTNSAVTVASVDYPGYGLSDGNPTEIGTYRNVHRLYDYLVEEKGFRPEDIYVDGFSIGTGPAIELAVTRPVGGLILEAPYLSAPRIVTKVRLLPIDPYPNWRRIGDVKCPILFLHGTADEIIPESHGRELFDLANEPKKYVVVEGAGHNDLVFGFGLENYLGEIRSYFDFPEIVKIEERPLKGDKDGLVPDEDSVTPAEELGAILDMATDSPRIRNGFVKITKDFGGFPWMRIECDAEDDSLRSCAAEMTFVAAKDSALPEARLRRLLERLQKERKLEIIRNWREHRGFEVLARTKGIKYRFASDGKISPDGRIRYTLGFSAERIVGEYEDRGIGRNETEHWDWADVVHETRVVEVEDESAWTYRFDVGKSSEELLDEWISTGEKSLLVSGYGMIGMTVARGTDESGSVCTEAEAEEYAPEVGAYVRSLDHATQLRLYRKLTDPKGAGETLYGRGFR